MDFITAREWLDEMGNLNASSLARDLFAQGATRDAVMASLQAKGVKHTTARKAIWYATEYPNRSPRVRSGERTGTAVTFRIDSIALEKLRLAAVKRKMSVHRLASEIMWTVIEDGMIDAVMDDQG